MPPHLFQPAHLVHAAGARKRTVRSDLVPDLARLEVALVDPEVAALLVGDAEQAAVLVQREVAGELASRGRELDEGELAVGRGLEGGDGVAGDGGAVGGVYVGHLLQRDIAVRGKHELAVGGDGDLGGGATSSYGRGAVGRDLVYLLEGEATGADIVDLVADDFVGQLVCDEEVGVVAGLPEGGVAGPVAGGSPKLCMLGEFACRGVRAEDVRYVQAEVREDNVLARGVNN